MLLTILHTNELSNVTRHMGMLPLYKAKKILRLYNELWVIL